MKIQILWAAPAERRFGSGDFLTSEQCAELGVDPQALIDAGEAQLIEVDKPKTKRGGGMMEAVKQAARSMIGGE